MALKMSLKLPVIEMLTADLESRQMLAIYLMDSGREMTDSVTKLDLTGIILYLCQRLGWTESSDCFSSIAQQTVVITNEAKILEKDVIESDIFETDGQAQGVIDSSGAYTPEPDHHEEAGKVFHCMICNTIFCSEKDF